MMIEDETGKLLPALKVFALSVRYMMDNIIHMCKQQISGIDQDDINRVLTVPAIWNDQAKHFMRLAALEVILKTSY
ncbi:hypothetical protein DPMN_148130 [Dreissena polymorpha]|uniref:Uncharacterized protein n=1 Tax=Dreissena polymorpha TaxID=45954 RepID=A0A9D4FBW7_DREPO|nr:hypothetical protein DPMN_148130 [Dreissena polymorpha]